MITCSGAVVSPHERRSWSWIAREPILLGLILAESVRTWVVSIIPLHPGVTPQRRARSWMMDSLSLCSILASVLFLLAFLASVVFLGPAELFTSEDLDFRGLTGVFFTLDMLPFVLLLVSNDAKVGSRSVEDFTHCGAPAFPSFVPAIAESSARRLLRWQVFFFGL